MIERLGTAKGKFKDLVQRATKRIQKRYRVAGICPQRLGAGYQKQEN